MTLPVLLAAAIAAAGSPAVATAPVADTALEATVVDVAPAAAVTEPTPAPPPPAPAALVLPKGTMLRLMVLNEVNSRDHKAGHRFVLRVDEEVKVGSAVVIPIGARAWGEVTSAQGTGGVGKSGKLDAKLLYVETGAKRVPLDGNRQSAGTGSTGQVVGAVVAFGIFGLFTKGNNATLKAGEIINGYTVEEARFDPPVVAAAQ